MTTPSHAALVIVDDDQPMADPREVSVATLRLLALVGGHQATAAAALGSSNGAFRQILFRLRCRGLIVTRRHGVVSLTQAGLTALAYDDRRG